MPAKYQQKYPIWILWPCGQYSHLLFLVDIWFTSIYVRILHDIYANKKDRININWKITYVKLKPNNNSTWLVYYYSQFSAGKPADFQGS